MSPARPIPPPRPPMTPERIAEYEALPRDLDPQYVREVGDGMALWFARYEREWRAANAAKAQAA